MRRGERFSFDMEDGFEGAVDVVFLLIIFFLVASSFDKTVREKLVLPPRDPEQATALRPQEREKLEIAVLEDATILVDHRPLDVVDTTSIEAYQAISRALEGWITGTHPDDGGADPAGTMEVLITADRRSPAGAALNAIMACLDRGITPQVLFEQERAGK
ncbi:MAG: biopolymer transporter ExbD [Acidobacteriota bacterium]|nr:biopolymer transporter ExbD [Acidobacteriota bacterium]MDQ7086549.1 biopolymer transporter ExbD [Acidobacteriota bacterium]